MVLQLLRQAFLPRRTSKLFTPETLANPYPLYERLRTESPVFHDDADGRFLVTRYADVVGLLRNPAASSQRGQFQQRFMPARYRSLASMAGSSMIATDGDAHHRQRLLVSKAFTARAIESMTGHIQQLVDGFLDKVQDRGHLEVIADLAYPLPVTVIAEMMGVPTEDLPRFKHWSDEISLTSGGMGSPANLRMSDYARAAAAYEELTDYFGRIVAQRRRQPHNDLLTALAQAEEAGERLTQQELYANAALLLAAGNETTTNLIGNGVYALLRNPDQLARLQADPELLPTAIEEFLRYDSPVQFTLRVLKQDTIVGGKPLHEGDVTLLVLASANRDAEEFTEPDRLDVGRRENRHLSFGLGTHFCLGANLARLEARIAIGTLLRRLPELRLTGPEPRYRPHFNLRGLESLPVAF